MAGGDELCSSTLPRQQAQPCYHGEETCAVLWYCCLGALQAHLLRFGEQIPPNYSRHHQAGGRLSLWLE